MPEPRLDLLPVDEAAVVADRAGLTPGIERMNIFRALLHAEHAAEPLIRTLTTLIMDAALDDRVRELVIMRVAWQTGSDYEWTQHWVIARRLDVPEADLLAVRGRWQDHPGFGAADRAALAATDDVLARGSVGDAAWSEVCAAFPTEQERVELVASIGLWRLVSTLLMTFGVPLEDDLSSWPPDGQAPTITAP